MLRALKNALPFAGHHAPRHRLRQFTPTVDESAARLEDRALLSAAGGSAHAAVAAHDLAATPSGQHVTAMFESILHTAPSQQQVTLWVHKIRAGASIKALQRHLVAEARTQASIQAAIGADPTVSVSPTGVVTVSGIGNGTTGMNVLGTVSPSSTIGTISPSSTFGPFGVSASLPAGLINSVVGNFNNAGSLVSISSAGTPSLTTGVLQMPMGTSMLAPAGGSVGLTATSTGGSGVVGTGTTTTTTIPTTTTSTGTTTSLTTIGSIPTLGQTTTTGTPATITPFSFNPTPLQFSPLTFAPVATVNSPINPSPLPTTGTLPFTGTPANPSPLPSNGTLPSTGTPANPSPVPTNGTVI